MHFTSTTLIIKPFLVSGRWICETVLLQGRRVLLAEDNLINQTVAKKVLTSLGMGCEVASDGQEAVEAVAQGNSRPSHV